jgi:hypothetical protein
LPPGTQGGGNKALGSSIVKYGRPVLGHVAVECRIEVELPGKEMAVEVARSISLDNGEYVRAEVVGRAIILTAKASTPASMLHTIEDLLSCLKVAEAIIEGGTEERLGDPEG